MSDILARLYNSVEQRFQVEVYKEATEAFASINGWELFDSDFRPKDIGKRSRKYHLRYGGIDLYDHCLYFRKVDGVSKSSKPRRIYKHVAIVAQPYGYVTLAEAQESVGPNLIVTQPPAGPLASFWYPGSTCFYVITQPDEMVKFLPEQYKTEERWQARKSNES